MMIVFDLIFIVTAIITISTTIYILKNTLVIENPFKKHSYFHDLEVPTELVFIIFLFGLIPIINIIAFILFISWYIYHIKIETKNTWFSSEVFNICGYTYMFKLNNTVFTPLFNKEEFSKV